MKEYRITCCSTADMPESYFTQKHIPYACFHFSMNGREYVDDLGRSISIRDFYAQIRQGALPVTSQINVDQYVQLFQPLLEAGLDVIHLTLSSGISGTINSALIARDQLLEQYPDRKITVIDSLAASSGYGLLLDAAWEKMNQGFSYDQLAQWILAHRLQVHHWFFSTDLTHFKRGGRISASAAFWGNVLNICPLMNVNAQGKLIPREKFRGKKKVIREMVERMKAHAQNGTDYSGKCFISHSDCLEDAQAVARLVEENFPNLSEPVQIFPIGTVIGSHTGPGTVALFFWGDERGQ